MVDVVDDVLTQLQSTLDDDVVDTRLLSCRVMTQLFSQLAAAAAAADVMDQCRLHSIYPALLKRLDDSSDDVRVAASQTFSAYVKCFHDNYDVALYRAHLHHIYHALLIHLDDPQHDIQRSILGQSLVAPSQPDTDRTVRRPPPSPNLGRSVFKFHFLTVSKWFHCFSS